MTKFVCYYLLAGMFFKLLGKCGLSPFCSSIRPLNKDLTQVSLRGVAVVRYSTLVNLIRFYTLKYQLWFDRKAFRKTIAIYILSYR